MGLECCGGITDHDDDCEVKVKDSIDEKTVEAVEALESENYSCLLYTSPSPRDS